MLAYRTLVVHSISNDANTRLDLAEMNDRQRYGKRYGKRNGKHNTH